MINTKTKLIITNIKYDYIIKFKLYYFLCCNLFFFFFHYFSMPESIRAKIFDQSVPKVDNDENGSNRLQDIIRNALEFSGAMNEGKEDEIKPIDKVDSGIQLFSGSKKVVEIKLEPKIKGAKEAFKVRTLKPFNKDDLDGGVIYNPSITSYPSNFIDFDPLQRKWQLGKVIDPNEPLPHRSRYWKHKIKKEKTIYPIKTQQKSKFSNDYKRNRPYHVINKRKIDSSKKVKYSNNVSPKSKKPIVSSSSTPKKNINVKKPITSKIVTSVKKTNNKKIPKNLLLL